MKRFLFLITLLFLGCAKPTHTGYFKTEIVEVTSTVNANGIQMVKFGFYAIPIKSDIEIPKTGDIIEITYELNDIGIPLYKINDEYVYAKYKIIKKAH